jgi:hypothetical protein
MNQNKIRIMNSYQKECFCINTEEWYSEKPYSVRIRIIADEIKECSLGKIKGEKDAQDLGIDGGIVTINRI